MSKLKAVYGNVYNFDKKTNKIKSKKDYTPRDLVYVLRSDNPDKRLSRGAKTLAPNYYSMINKSPNKIIFVTHDFISSITQVGNNQNKNLHNELRDLFNIQYHKSVRVDGKKCYHGFTIEFTENTEIILENPNLFYSSKTEQNCHLSDRKMAVERQKNGGSLSIEEEEPIEVKYRSTETPEKACSAFEALKSNSVSKTLQDFHPLSYEDCVQLQIMSSRDFSLNAMNEILLDMSKKLTAPSFQSKKVS